MKVVSTARLKLDRVTKGAVLYKNIPEDDGLAITSIYLRKEALAEPFPIEITITVTVPDGI